MGRSARRVHARAAWQAPLEGPPEQMLARLANAVAQLMGRAARLLAVGESVGPVDLLLNEFRKRGRAATRADTLKGAEALKRAGVLRDGMSTEQATDIIYAIASSESVYLRLVEHRGWTDEAYAKVIEHAPAGALSR